MHAPRGQTWSAPLNLSDDESGHGVGYARVVADAQGRVYAVWKYQLQLLTDGPGGNAGGLVVYRCLTNGQWSKPVALNAAPAPPQLLAEAAASAAAPHAGVGRGAASIGGSGREEEGGRDR